LWYLINDIHYSSLLIVVPTRFYRTHVSRFYVCYHVGGSVHTHRTHCLHAACTTLHVTTFYRTATLPRDCSLPACTCLTPRTTTHYTHLPPHLHCTHFTHHTATVYRYRCTPPPATTTARCTLPFAHTACYLPHQTGPSPGPPERLSCDNISWHKHQLPFI